jgi:8-oxo-dGTP pyrophosphatase MutT (NUDIX family)
MANSKSSINRPFRHRVIHRAYRIAEPFRLAFRWVRRPLSLGVRGLVVNGNGEVLLVRHTYMDGWFLPGGGVKRRESVRQGLDRELIEEVGVTLKSEPELLGLYSNSFGFRSDHVALFVVRDYAHSHRENAEIAEWGFYSMSALPDGVGRGTRDRLAEFQGRREKCFDW